MTTTLAPQWSWPVIIVTISFALTKCDRFYEHCKNVFHRSIFMVTILSLYWSKLEPLSPKYSQAWNHSQSFSNYPQSALVCVQYWINVTVVTLYVLYMYIHTCIYQFCWRMDNGLLEIDFVSLTSDWLTTDSL